MTRFLEPLARRRAALVERSSAQRAQMAAATTELRRGLAAPALLGVGVAVTMLSSSPKLRTWVIRAWAAYTFLRRLLDK